MVMFKGVPIEGSRRSRVRISDKAKVESERSKVGSISLILGSEYGVTGWYTTEIYYCSMRALRDRDYSEYSLTSY